MRRQIWVPLTIAIASGCLVPRYAVDDTAAGGKMSVAGAPATSMAGTSTNSMGGAGVSGCGPLQKLCGAECVDVDDVNYGCTATSCNKSACPAAEAAELSCQGGACVIGSCGAGTKKCAGKCVAINDPTYGCGETSCDAVACPDPGGGAILCSGTSCVVGECGANTKQCANKCVPLDANNGCSDVGVCSACPSNETCIGDPAVCGCTPNDVEACKGVICGSAKNNCGKLVDCPNTCAAPTPVCSGNTCIACNVAADCPDQGNVCARAACTNHECTSMLAPTGTICPAGACSTTLVGVCVRQPVDAGGVSIDATEVTRGQYAAFVKAKAGNMSGQPSYCSWNASYEPSAGYPPAIKDYDLPAGYVDWCDAFEYCKSAGRRLCGKIGGGPLGQTEADKPALSQWLRACMGPSLLAYPYGNAFGDGKCNGGPVTRGCTAVASLAQCIGGYPGLYDMSGNVTEWLDACNTSTGRDDLCISVGGDYYYASTLGDGSLRCDFKAGTHRVDSADALGFRCCGN